MEHDTFRRHAETVASAFAGEAVTEVRRFPTGVQHFVFEAIFERHSPIVVRLSRPADRRLAAGAVWLSSRLRPIGVPLPNILDADVDALVPCVIMERLPGADLGEVIAVLEPDTLRAVARAVADAQAAVTSISCAGRFGFAVEASEAPFGSWAEFVRAHVHRSRKRIATAGLFRLTYAARVEALIDRNQPLLEQVAAIPFLHDTTLKNVIVADDRLSGIVDVDELCFGDPRYVVALTRAALIARNASTRYVCAWMREAAWQADDLFELYTAAYLLDLMGEHGHPANGNERCSTAELRDRLEEEIIQVLDALEG